MYQNVVFDDAFRAQLKRIAGDCEEEMWYNVRTLEDREIQARELLRKEYARRAATVGMSLEGYCTRFGIKL